MSATLFFIFLYHQGHAFCLLVLHSINSFHPLRAVKFKFTEIINVQKYLLRFFCSMLALYSHLHPNKEWKTFDYHTSHIGRGYFLLSPMWEADWNHPLRLILMALLRFLLRYAHHRQTKALVVPLGGKKVRWSCRSIKRRKSYVGQLIQIILPQKNGGIWWDAVGIRETYFIVSCKNKL